ncbi:hypothetical protein [Burkholderia cepacia]|uniref:hypothetical protein n=1 Tax=Burkholderia cepacia TaxID=292 RepID=UPI000ADFFFBF|nr:hypothetical protein [Burkholderia cepacia]
MHSTLYTVVLVGLALVLVAMFAFGFYWLATKDRPPPPTTPAASSPVRVSLGCVFVSAGAIDALQAVNVPLVHFLIRHLRSDWGRLTDEDWQRNERVLETGDYLLLPLLSIHDHCQPESDRICIFEKIPNHLELLLGLQQKSRLLDFHVNPISLVRRPSAPSQLQSHSASQLAVR